MHPNAPSLRSRLLLAGAVGLAGPLLVTGVVAAVTSPTLALAAGLAACLLTVMVMLALGWQLTRQVERLASAAAHAEARAAEQARRDQLAAMRREIRTSMNGVIGMASLLLETPLDPVQRECAEAIRESGEALLAIVDDLPDVSADAGAQLHPHAPADGAPGYAAASPPRTVTDRGGNVARAGLLGDLAPRPVTGTVSKGDAVSSAGRVLVVEDDPVGQRIALHLVGRFGYPVDAVSGGQAAVEAVSTNQYALVLMDCQMPDVDGYMATAEIRRREAAAGDRARRVPIVALTASSVESDRVRGLAAGMDEYLTKPIDSQQLAALLARWVAGPAVPASVASPLATSVEGGGLPPSSDPAVLDPAVLDPAGLLGAGTALSPAHREIVALFLDEAPRRLTALDAAAARGDHAEAARLAHTLAGSASSLGASRLAAACASIEALARAERDRDPALLAASASAASLSDGIADAHHQLRQLQEALASTRTGGAARHGA